MRYPSSLEGYEQIPDETCGLVPVDLDTPIPYRLTDGGVTGTIAVRGGMTMTTVEEESKSPVCSVCSRLTGFGDEDKGEPPVNFGRCPSSGGMECRAVAHAVAGYHRENQALRSNCDHLSSENASLSSQVESMAMRIESLAEELAKPDDVRLREVTDALEGRAVIFDSLAQRVSHVLDEMDEWIARAGAAERLREAAVHCLHRTSYRMDEHTYQEMASALEAPPREA